LSNILQNLEELLIVTSRVMSHSLRAMTRSTSHHGGDRTSLVFDPRQIQLSNLGSAHEMNIQVQEEGTTITYHSSGKPLVVKNDLLYRRLS
jgi:hypothetical protein